MSNRAQDLGQRFTCFKCECKFYDLCSPEPLCPRCGADQRENLGATPPAPKRRGRAKKAEVVQPAKKVELLDAGGDDLLDDGFAATGADDAIGDEEEGPPMEEPAAKKAAKKPAAKKAAKKPAAKKAAKKPAAKKAAKKPAAKK